MASDCSRSDLLYFIPPSEISVDSVRSILAAHPQIQFVSLVAIDLGGNDIDERIPVRLFLDSVEEVLAGGVQTDGSSVILPGIALLNNAKIDIVCDTESRWTVDYNYEHIDPSTGLPVGTLRIPSFLVHEGRMVDSRAVLARATAGTKKTVLELLSQRPELYAGLGIKPGDISDVQLTIGTELEFWVKTPGEQADIEQLSASQVMQEQYWKRTKGNVRTALEQSLIMLEKYGLAPEMGHKEVGGVKARVEGAGHLGHIMEQLEIDWKYAQALQAADNELLARITIRETFRQNGLDVTFMAKPIEGVAGNGEHIHLGVALKLTDGRKVNLFTAPDPQNDFLSVFGWGALMGVLHHYETVGSLVTCTNDAFNRLKPGFEAPICIVACIGHSVQSPSRNRSVLAGLIRDVNNPLATRFEIRSPNPHTNTYLAVAGFLQAACDGMRYAAGSQKTSKQLEAEFSKLPGEQSDYLVRDRQYRSEEDVFEHYTEEQRLALFGKPPATVWEAMQNLDLQDDRTAVLLRDDVFTRDVLSSFKMAMIRFWAHEVLFRIIPENADLVRACVKLHDDAAGNDLDVRNWSDVQDLRRELLQSSGSRPSLFARIREAANAGNYSEVSRLQLVMTAKVKDLRHLYTEYRRNLLEPKSNHFNGR